MGTPQFSVKILDVLNKSNYDIQCVYTQPPKKSSRGQKVQPSAVQKFAEQHNLKIRTPHNLSVKEELDFFKSLKPYIVIVVAYGKIIPKNYLDIPSKGFLNIHASLLPKWRGAAPIHRAIMNNEKKTGISFMKIEEKLDSGPYMKQLEIKITEQSTTKQISDELSKLSAENILECLELIEKNLEKFINQDENQATYAKKIDKKESRIDWTKDAKTILAKINGLNPNPGAWFEHKDMRFKIWKAKISDLTGNPGEVLTDNLTIGCNDKSIKIIELQKEGKNKLKAEKFMIGNKILKGEKIF